jgi:hypothetical protein
VKAVGHSAKKVTAYLTGAKPARKKRKTKMAAAAA